MKKILLMAAMMLALPMMAQEEDYHQIEALITGGGYELAENVPAMKINSFADLINKRPAMPTANDLLTPEAKTAYARRSSAAYYLGVQNFRSALLDAQAELNSKTLELGKKQQKSNQKGAWRDAHRREDSGRPQQPHRRQLHAEQPREDFGVVPGADDRPHRHQRHIRPRQCHRFCRAGRRGEQAEAPHVSPQRGRRDGRQDHHHPDVVRALRAQRVGQRRHRPDYSYAQDQFSDGPSSFMR